MQSKCDLLEEKIMTTQQGLKPGFLGYFTLHLYTFVFDVKFKASIYTMGEKIVQSWNLSRTRSRLWSPVGAQPSMRPPSPNY